MDRITIFFKPLDSSLEMDRRTIDLWPGRALDECNRKLHDFVVDRYYSPALMLLGLETYWNLCYDLHSSGSVTLSPEYILKPTEFRGITILVDDYQPWLVKCISEMKRMYPQYGEKEVKGPPDFGEPH